jgi:prolyl-tRNA synthetase
VCELLQCELTRSIKSVMINAHGKLYMLLLRGDHALNEIKAAKLPELAGMRLASAEEIEQATGCRPGFIGPVGLDPAIGTIADRSAAALADFVCGANEPGFHLAGVNFGRDLPEPDVADLRDVVAGDPSPDGRGVLEICRGIEVGHIFQLRKKYSEAMGVSVLDEAGKLQTVEMGCYGIGVTRIVAAAIEQNHDSRGIVFPAAIAPFQVAIVPIGAGKSEKVRSTAERLHEELAAAGMEVLLDDRDERPGAMFADMDLIGIPYRIVVGDRGLAAGEVEFKGRREEQATPVAVDRIVDYTRTRISAC